MYWSEFKEFLAEKNFDTNNGMFGLLTHLFFIALFEKRSQERCRDWRWFFFNSSA